MVTLLSVASTLLPFFGNNVGATFDLFEAIFDFVERTKFQRRIRSTLLPVLATKSNVASTLLLVWTGFKAASVNTTKARRHGCSKIMGRLFVNKFSICLCPQRSLSFLQNV